jgi:hypothetical protein
LGGKVGSEEGLKEQVCEQVGRSKLVENWEWLSDKGGDFWLFVY